MVKAPTGTVSLFFSDIQGSTRMWEHFGDRFKEVIDTHNQLFRHALNEFNGYEVKFEGDAFMISFVKAWDAIQYAIAIQDRLQNANWSPFYLEEQNLEETVGIDHNALFRGARVRIGIHTGHAASEIDKNTGRMDYFGTTVNRAARVSAAGHGGQILISQATWLEAKAELEKSDIVITNLGEHALKGLEGTEEIRQISSTGFAERVFPKIRTIDLTKTNLPNRADSFIGRINELEKLRQHFANNSRLITMVGTGGTGKTRLAQQYGSLCLHEYRGGVWFCDLTEARNLAAIWTTVGTALDITLSHKNPKEQLAEELCARGKTLIIVDNFEQVADFAAETLSHWLRVAPEAHFLITSRSRLQIEGEQVFYLDPLPAEEAIQLFQERALAVKPDFQLTDAITNTVLEIVNRLDRMSLAIELAAARITILNPKQLLERLSQRFKLLRQNRRDLGPKQITLRGTIDWSWNLLQPWEKLALAQLSVFRGGFTLEASESVLDVEILDDGLWAMDILQALLDKSLLQVRKDSTGNQRFSIYESIREYATEQLETKGNIVDPNGESISGAAALENTSHRFANYYSQFGEEKFLVSLHTHGGVELTKALALDLDNLLTALHRSLSVNDWEIALKTFLAVSKVLTLRGPCLLIIELANLILNCPGLETKSKSMVLLEQGRAMRLVGQLAAARQALGESKALSLAVGDRKLQGASTGEFAVVSELDGKMGEARRNYEDALAIHREVGNLADEAIVLGNLGILNRIQGNGEESRKNYQDALTIHRRTGNRRSEGIALCNLGNLYFQEGKLEVAQRSFEDSLLIFKETGNRRDEALVLGNLGDLCLDAEKLEEAKSNLEAAVKAAASVGLKRAQGAFLGSLAALYAKLGELSLANKRIENGEGLLREVDDKLELGRLLCRKGYISILSDASATAQTSLHEAREIANELEVGENSHLAQDILKLEEALRTN